MSVTSLALKICILPGMEGNMLGIVYWLLCSLRKGEQIWTGNSTPQYDLYNDLNKSQNIYHFAKFEYQTCSNARFCRLTSFNRPGKCMSRGTIKAGYEHAKTDFWLVRKA